MSFTALLLATLLVLALYRIAAAAMAGAGAWCPPLAPPSTTPSQLAPNRHGVTVIDAPCAPPVSFAEPKTVLAGWRCIRDRHGGRPDDGGSCAQAVLARAPGQIPGRVVIVSEFDTIWATLGALHGRNQRAVTVSCTRL